MRLIWCWLLIFSAVASPVCQGAAHEAILEEGAAAKLLGLEPPVEVGFVGVYEDGGTVGFKLGGIGKPTLMACFDGRMFLPSPRNIYLGALYPTHPGARALKLNGAEDRAVVLLIRTWLERTFSPQELNELREVARTGGFDSTRHRDAGTILRALEWREATLALYRDEDACASTFGLRAPVTLMQVVPSDSAAHTLGFVLRSNGKGELRGCFHRTRPSLPEGIWVGATAPVQDSLIYSLVYSLSSRGKKETAILGLLNHWFERNPPGVRNDSTATGIEPRLLDLLFQRMRLYQHPDLRNESGRAARH